MGSFKRLSQFALILFLILSAFSLTQLSTDVTFIGPGIAEAKITPETAAPQDNSGLNEFNPHVRAAMAVQDRHTPELLSIPGVLGTATGLDEEGNPAILVFTESKAAPGMIPDHLEGFGVREKITGKIVAMAGVDNTAAFTPPIPIGVSTGNIGECSAGTISARVKDGSGNIFALSNNHVYALENSAPIGSQVLQPGLYDSGCSVTSGTNSLGTLYSFVRINFKRTSKNRVDAAIALSSSGLLGNSTPSGGYGIPSSTTLVASVGQSVQKYGRTTSLTVGSISGINATVQVSYGPGKTATFVNQITVSSGSAFIQAGDSGSLLVTNDSNANPVGLLFAGNSSGTFAVANQIGDVLSSFHIAIDGK